jgi:hypothetical protein
MRPHAVAIAALAALPPVLLSLWSVNQSLTRFSDPCFQWGTPQSSDGGYSMSATIAPGSPCRHMGGTSETKTEAIVKMVLVPGGILLASLLGLVGTLLSRPSVTVLGAGLMFLESAPLIFSFAFLTVFVSGLFLVAARQITELAGTAQIGARLIGSLAALWALSCAVALARETALFLIFLLIGLIFVALAGWLPPRKPEIQPTGRSPASSSG